MAVDEDDGCAFTDDVVDRGCRRVEVVAYKLVHSRAPDVRSYRRGQPSEGVDYTLIESHDLVAVDEVADNVTWMVRVAYPSVDPRQG